MAVSSSQRCGTAMAILSARAGRAGHISPRPNFSAALAYVPTTLLRRAPFHDAIRVDIRGASGKPRTVNPPLGIVNAMVLCAALSCSLAAADAPSPPAVAAQNARLVTTVIQM